MSANAVEVLDDIKSKMHEGMPYRELEAMLTIALISAVSDVADELRQAREAR